MYSFLSFRLGFCGRVFFCSVLAPLRRAVIYLAISDLAGRNGMGYIVDSGRLPIRFQVLGPMY